MLRNFKPDRVHHSYILGKGSFGIVCAYGDKKRYVVKLLSINPINPASVFNEMSIGFNLNHPHLLPILGYYISGSQVYLKMERKKRSLAEFLKEEERDSHIIDEAQVVQISYRIATALDYLHSRKIAHRDLKPSNVLLDENGNAFVSDLGLCISMLESDDTTTLLINEVSGTPVYLAPEIRNLENRGSLHAKDLYLGDAWSLGATMLDICLAKAEGIRDESSIGDKLNQVLERYGPKIYKVLSKLLEKPEERMSCNEACEYLEKNYPEALENTLDPTREISIEKIEESMEKIYSFVSSLNEEFTKEFRFCFSKRQLWIAAKDPLSISGETLQMLSNELANKLKQSYQRVLKSIEIDLGCCSKLTEKDISNFLILDSSRFHLQELKLHLFGCENINAKSLVSFLHINASSLKNLNALTLNISGWNKLTTEGVQSLFRAIANFTKLEKLNLDFSGCKEVNMGICEAQEIQDIFSSHLVKLKKFKLNLNQTKSSSSVTSDLFKLNF